MSALPTTLRQRPYIFKTEMRDPMRHILFSLVLGGSMISCNTEPQANSNFRIATFSGADLTYPKNPLKIEDSTRTRFIENFFLPWSLEAEKVLASLELFPGKDLTFLQNYLEDNQWYGENKKPHKRFIREEIVSNISTADFPNFQKKGIVVSHTNLRRIPSNKPGFDTYSKAGEGYPFDYFQETNLWANTPLQLLHLSKDKQWCYVLSPYYKGWVPMHDLALVSDEFMAQWRSKRYGVPVSDQITLSDPTSNYAVTGKMGMVLPIEETADPKIISAFYANADENQLAHLLRAEIDSDQIATDAYKFDAEHLKQLISQLEGRPYGWGGYLENRDCSSMIRDLMATFKFWLPRDSGDQLKVGNVVELTGSLEDKLEVITSQGIPFRTILRKKGHNMLYVGKSADGEPLIFHAAWGLRTTYTNPQLSEFLKDYPIEGLTQQPNGTITGRNIMGEAMITSVLAGSGNQGITYPMLEDIYAMTILLE